MAIADATVLAQSGEAVHPVLVASGDPADCVAGVVLRLSDAELAAADAYEVVAYARVEVAPASGGRCRAYVSAAAGGAGSATGG